MPNIVPIEMINAHFEHNHVFRWTNTIILCSIGSGLGWGMKSTSSTIVVVVDRRLRFHHRRRHTNTYWHRNRIAFITLADRFSTNKRREKKKIPTYSAYSRYIRSYIYSELVSNDIQMSRQCVTRRLRNEIPFRVLCVPTYRVPRTIIVCAYVWVAVCLCLV